MFQEDEPAKSEEKSNKLFGMLQSLTQNLSELEQTLHSRDLAFSQKLDDIRNIALADLEIQDTMEDIATKFSQFQQHMIDTVKEKRLSSYTAEDKHSTTEDVKNESPKTLDRNLKILSKLHKTSPTKM